MKAVARAQALQEIYVERGLPRQAAWSPESPPTRPQLDYIGPLAVKLGASKEEAMRGVATKVEVLARTGELKTMLKKKR